ncbi:MAG: glycosyltransferase family 39 protein [Xanthomonadales bacterium]|nr:glycosyltransferase family 39 protein [Xanthomonadales bacterium]
MLVIPAISTRLLTVLSVAMLACLGCWLTWSALTVTVDSEDGYATLVNSLFYMQRGDHFLLYRPPLMAVLLMPAELLKSALQLQPMDMRAAHAVMALFNLIYLIGLWRMLVRVYGLDMPVLMAYAAAVLTPVFFSYAPFLNFDIFPGLLALGMVWLAARQLQEPSTRIWMALVIIGAALALIKQTYALIWVGLVVAMPVALIMEKATRTQWLTARQLVLGAALSGLLTWIGYAIALAPAMASDPFWLRPWLQITLITENYQTEGGAWAAFYAWVYLQNLWAYGLLAVALVVPGLAYCLARGSLFERLVALVWLFLVTAFHLTPYKEVRYLLVLAPLTAVLLVPVLRLIWQSSRAYRGLTVLVLVTGLSLSLAEAIRIRDPFYSQGITVFFEPLPKPEDFTGKLIFGRPLSFVSPESTAFFGDRYHRIMHMTISPIVAFHGYVQGQYLQVENADEVTADRVAPGDIAILASGALGRVAPFKRGNKTRLAQDFLQVLGLAEPITLTRAQAGYQIAGSQPGAQYLIVSTQAKTLPSLASMTLDEGEAVRLFGWTSLPESAEVMAFRLLRRCTLSGCVRLDKLPPDAPDPA